MILISECNHDNENMHNLPHNCKRDGIRRIPRWICLQGLRYEKRNRSVETMSEETPIWTPVWKFDKIRITSLDVVFKDGKKSKKDCTAAINFGFFYIFDIGINRDNEDRLAWSTGFGWSKFRFNDSCLDNPYEEEVRKVERMIKTELEKNRSTIIEFLDYPHLEPKLIKDRSHE